MGAHSPNLTRPLGPSIRWTGRKRKHGESSRIIDFIMPYAASGVAAVPIFRPGIAITYAWKGCECCAPNAWPGASPPAPTTVSGTFICPPLVEYVLAAVESSGTP
eukprot:scaffold100695_cov32-Tisochrysis_lutea.AAC.4